MFSLSLPAQPAKLGPKGLPGSRLPSADATCCLQPAGSGMRKSKILGAADQLLQQIHKAVAAMSAAFGHDRAPAGPARPPQPELPASITSNTEPFKLGTWQQHAFARK